MFMPVWSKILVSLLAFCLIVGMAASGGYVARGWKDSREALKISQELDNKRREIDKIKIDIVTTLDAKLSERNAQRPAIQKIITKEIEKPVYRNICISAEGKDIINKWAEGKFDEKSSID